MIASEDKLVDIERRISYTEKLITHIKDEQYAMDQHIRHISDKFTSCQIIISGILAIVLTFIILIFYVYL